jgi:hypothetical protein
VGLHRDSDCTLESCHSTVERGGDSNTDGVRVARKVRLYAPEEEKRWIRIKRSRDC